MANGGKIEFGIGFKVDKTGLNEVKTTLASLSKLSPTNLLKLNPDLNNINQATSAMMKLRDTVEKVDKAYDVAFDSKTGLTNIQTLNQELNKIGIDKIQKDLNAAGVAGQRAFTQISSSVLTMNVKLKQTTNFLDKMGETFLNTIKWSISSKIINSFTASIQQAWGYVQHLDTSLNDIRIVTGKSSEEMDNFAVKANDAAKALGSATTEYTEAALIFYQQGLSDEESQARAETTIKAANVTGQTGEQVSQELTAVWNGYKVTAEETELYVDKLAAVAATTAADLEELSTGMSKVASAAANMGVDIDQLNAQLATIVSVTRQAPESVGTALKTIYARIEDLKLGGEDEDGTQLGQVSSGLESMGVEIKDAQGNLRDLGEVIEEIGGKWDSWTESQQAAIAQLVAGKRQYNNLIALFDNWDMYSSSLETSKNAMGTLQEQQDIYMESTAAHLQKLKTQWEDLYDSVLDTDTINDVTDGFTKILSLVTKFIDAIGGGKGALLSLGAVATQVFSKTIGQQLGNIILNFKHISSNAAIFTQLKANVKDWAQQMGVAFDSAPAQKMLDTQKQMIEVWGLMTNEEKEASQEIVRQVGLIEQEKQELEQASNKVKEFVAKANVSVGGDISGKSFVATDSTGVSQHQRDAVKDAIEKEEAAVKKLETAYKDLTTAQQKGASASKANNNAAKIKEYSAAEQALKNMKAQYKALKNLDLPDGEVQKFKNAVEKAENALKKMNQTGKVDGVNNALKNAMSQGSKLLETAKGEVQGLKTTIEQGKEAMHGLEAEEQKVQQSMGEMLEKLNTQKFAQGVSQIASGFLSLTSAATSFKTVLTTLGDENLSFTEKMSGAFTGLLSSVSMLAMSYTSLTSGLQTLTVATGLFTTAEEAQKAGILGTVMALAAKLVGVELDMNATLADNVAKIANAAASWLAANANLGFAAGLGTAAAAALGLDAALAPLLAVLLPIIAAMAALTIGITAAVVASKNHEKQLKKEKESLEYINKAQKERVQRANEEKEAIDSLADSYNELLAQRDEEGNLSEEQTIKLYELVKAYGDQDMIIQALAGHYDELTESIRNKQAAENDEAIQTNERAIKTAEAQLTNDIKLNAKGSQEDASGYDLYGFGGFDKHDSFRKDLEKQFGVSIDSSGHIAWEDLNKLLTSDSLALNNFLTAHEHDSKEAVQQIRGLLSDNEAKINEIKSYQETSQSQLLDAIGYEAQDKIDNIESLYDYEETLNDLTAKAAQQILDKNKGMSESEAHEQGEQWARSFIAGQSEELEALDNANYIKDAITDAIIPDADSLDDRISKIYEKLEKYSQGGQVDLTNRPIIDANVDEKFAEDYNLGPNDYATLETATFGNEATGYVNFTPIIVDPKTGEYQGYLTPDELEDYANKVLSGVQVDDKNLQIGSYFNTVDEADRAAQSYHNLHEELVTLQQDSETYDELLKDRVYVDLENMSIAQQQFMAQNVDYIKALAADGQDIDAIFSILNKDLDTINHEDHLVKIQAVLDEKSADKLQEKINDLFADESFDIPFTQEEFEDFDEDERLVALTSLREQETNAIKENWEINKAKYQEELNAIQKFIPEQEKKVQSLKDEAQQQQDAYDTWKKQTLDKQLDTENFDMATALQSTGFNGSLFNDDSIEYFTEEYSTAMEKLGDIYAQAEAEGKDFIDVLGGQWQTLASEDVQKYVEALIQVEQKHGDADYNLEDLAKQWSEGSKGIKKYEKELEDAEDTLDSYLNRQQEIEDMDPSNIDWSRELDYTKEAVDAVNDSIDELQGSYQALQGIVEDYNADGQLSLDNLQSLMTMDSQYVASLQMVNGELQLNDDIYRSEIDTKIDYLKYLALETLNQELLKIAEQGNIYANEALAESNVYTTETIDAMSDAAVRGKEALLELQNVKAAYNKSAEATNIAIDAYYNKLAMIDNLSSQSTSSILGSSSSSSSSSGSSSSSESEPDEKDELKITDIDLYRGINEELEKMESILGRIQEIDEHSWGASAIKALEAEGELLEDQIEKYEEKRELQEGDLSKKKGELEAEGIQFSEDGSTMTNASEKLKSLYEEYNSMVASYNAMSKTEQDEYEDTLEKKKEAIDNLEDAIDDYESLYSDWQDTLDTLLDKQYELIENAVSQFNATVDLHLELDDAEKDWNDFWYDVVKDIDDSGVEDKIESLAEKISKSLSNLTTLVGYGANAAESSVGELTDHLNKTIDEVKKQIATASTGGSGSIFGIDTEKSKETLTDYRDRLIEAVTEAKEAVDDIADTYLDMLDAAQDKIDKQVEGWESINDHLEHNVKLIKLISGEDSYDALNKQYERQYENDKNLLNTAKQSQEFWKEQISHYQELMNNTEKGSKQWKTYSKALETATDNYRDSVNKLDKALEDALSNLDEWRKNQEDAALKTLDRAMSGGLGLDLVEQQWKLIDDHSSKYLDNVEKAISLEQYTNELEKAANEVGLSAENQAKLNKFRDEELSKLNTKAKLTKYDIEESRARLEIMRQEMLLEEQKNNKSNMRLRRDSQGNYSYQYTGNEEEEEEAEDGLLTAKQAWYDLVKSRYKETREWILELEKEQSALLAQIKDAEAADDVERLNYLKEMYETNAKDISDAYAEAEKNKRDLFDGTAQYFADVENAQILPQSKATVSTLIDQWAAGGEQSFIGAVEKAVTDLDEIQQEYLTKQNELLQEAGVNYEDLKNDGIDPTTDSLGDLVDTNEELAEQLEQVNDQLTQQEENLRAAEEAYNSLKDAAVTAIQEANEWLKTLAETAVETVSTVQKAIESAESSASSYANSAGSKTSSGGSSDGSNSGSSSGASYILGPSKSGAHNTFGVYRKGDDTSNPDNAIDSGTPSELKKRYQSGEVQGLYKSGGYTGDWIKGIPGTDNGRLAVLHPKELVLNESDTSNILKAVDTIRDLVSSSSSLDLGGIAQSIIQIGSSQAQMLAQVGSGIMSAMSSVVSNSQSYNSNMTVNADFSGVRSAEAIYQALRELENYGSQQAYSNAPHMNKAY